MTYRNASDIDLVIGSEIFIEVSYRLHDVVPVTCSVSTDPITRVELVANVESPFEVGGCQTVQAVGLVAEFDFLVLHGWIRPAVY